MTYYEILQVSDTATAEVIHMAYKALAKKYHPDVCKDENAEEMLKMINEAYDVLSNDEKRKKYNESLEELKKKAEGQHIYREDYSASAEKTTTSAAENSDKKESSEQKGERCSGCFSTCLGWIFWIVVIAWVWNSYGDNVKEFFFDIKNTATTTMEKSVSEVEQETKTIETTEMTDITMEDQNIVSTEISIDDQYNNDEVAESVIVGETNDWIPETDLSMFELSEDGKTILDIKDRTVTEIRVPEGIEAIVSHGDVEGLSFCKNLQTLVLPKSLKYIGYGAIFGCLELKEIKIPEGMEEIGESAFSNCMQLQKVEISSSVKVIGESAFAWCDNLTTVIISEGVEKIGAGAFFGCESLETVELPESLKQIEYGAFSATGLISITIPAGITFLDNGFNECSNLKSITIPDSVTFIGDSLFMGVSPEFVIRTTPGSYAERYCESHKIPIEYIE